MRMKIEEMVRVTPDGHIEIFGAEQHDYPMGYEAAHRWLEDNEYFHLADDDRGEIWFRHTEEERQRMAREVEEMDKWLKSFREDENDTPS